MTDDATDLEDIAEPATPAQVAARALVLSVVACRGILDGEEDRSGARSFWQRVLAWWEPLGLQGELEPNEAEVLSAQFGTLPRQTAVNAGWRSEALVVLAWALGRAEIPPHDQQADPSVIASSLGFLVHDTVLAAPTLRAPHELEQYRDIAFTVHWRLRDFSLRPSAMDFARFCETAWFGPLSLDGVKLVEGDLSVNGQAIARGEQSAVARAMSIAQERHQAINWIVDARLPLSEADTST